MKKTFTFSFLSVVAFALLIVPFSESEIGIPSFINLLPQLF